MTKDQIKTTSRQEANLGWNVQRPCVKVGYIILFYFYGALSGLLRYWPHTCAFYKRQFIAE